MLVTIVTPTKNSSALIEKHYKNVSTAILLQGWSYELIYVDDGSQDSSLNILSNLSLSDNRVTVLSLSYSHGQQTAIAAGFMRARGDVVITLDVDLEISEGVIAPLVQKVEDGIDYVPVYRINRISRGIVRELGSSVFNYYMRARTGLKLFDFGCGAAAHSNALIRRMRASKADNFGLKHLAGQLANRILNYPAEEVKVGDLSSSYNLRLLFRALLKEHSIRPGLRLPCNSDINGPDHQLGEAFHYQAPPPSV